MTTDTPPPAAAVDIAEDAIDRCGMRGWSGRSVCEALHRAGWLHNPDDIIRDRDAARAEIDRLAGELRAERKSHAETWQRAGESGRQLVEARAAAENGQAAADRVAALELVAKEARLYADRNGVLHACLARLDATTKETHS